ncbi:rho GTPase-activating protein 19-like [Mya arenaria]|uniref:rho GTPase-activating protein 19-like n=1 Tax=Mya arenaria TaxID=6604 RepID=UPI0022E7D336|nr:rho GTPase-activating protein 19-like [Mya arenaria]
MSLVSSITQAVKTVPDLKKSITDPGFQVFHTKDLCEIESQRSGPTEAERGVVRLRDAMPEKIATFCKAHLSSLLHMDDHKLDEIVQTHITDHNANKKNATTILSKKKERSASSTALSKELVYAMSKFVDYLSQSENLKTEGIFRKTGNVARQRLLKGLVLGNTGDFNLNDNTFSPHDVATVLKQILSEMPDPLLTHKHYEAHLKIADMTKLCVSEQEEKRALEKQIKSLQMLMLLLPQENAAFLETLLKLLHRTASCPENKMTATSLGVVFAPSIVCPRKLSAEGLQSASGTLSNAITLMIENTDSIFKVPREIAADVANFWQERENPSMELLAAQDCNEEDRANIQKAKNRSSSAVNTVYMFAERKSPEEYKCAQDTKTVLSQLIAHVHSAKKLLKPLNRVGNVQKSNKKGNHSRSRSFGESIKKHLPLLSNVKLHNLRDDEELKLSVTSPVITENSVANITYLNTPYNKYTPVLRHSQAVHIVDLGAST